MSEFFLHRYRALGEEADPSVEPKQALRINTVRKSDAHVLAALKRQGVKTEKIPYLAHGHYATAEFSLGSTKEYLLGWYYLQAPLSQLACEILAPSAEDIVLDMAAAPGSKTTYLATMAHSVVALDIDARRLAAVRNNVERLGLLNVVCVKKDARFAPDLKERFTRVLLDAPCSGNFCSEEGWFEKRTLPDIRKNSRVQKELFKAAWKCLAPGGKMVYSTCSLEPEEDELIIDWAKRRYDDLEILPIDTSVGDPGVVLWEGEGLDPGVANTRRFWPHRTGCEGFFIALLGKK